MEKRNKKDYDFMINEEKKNSKRVQKAYNEKGRAYRAVKIW